MKEGKGRMKKTLKGIVLASLISTQVLATPISALAITAETSESSSQTTEETSESVASGDESEDTSAATEVPNQEESTEVTTEETEKTEETVTSEGQTESSTTPSEESEAAASEEKKQELKDLITSAWTTLKTGTFLGETTAPLKDALAAAEALLDGNKTTDAQLDAAIAEISAKLAALESVEYPELSFVLNLINAINDGSEIIEGSGYLGDKYTEASVNARKEQIQAAVNAGQAVLESLYKPNTNELDVILALANQAEIIAATDAIIDAINGGSGLARTDMLKDILFEASQLAGSKVPGEYLQDKTNFEAAFEQAVNALDNAMTNEEIQNAINALRTAMDNLHLLVVVSVVDESGSLIVNQAATSKIGLYKDAWAVEPPIVEGYEFVSTSNEPMTFAVANTANLAGTFGDGTNDVTLVYKKTGIAKQVPLDLGSNQLTNQPVTIGVTNQAKPLAPAKPTLPETGEKSSMMTGFGIVALAGATLAFFKKRKIKE